RRSDRVKLPLLFGCKPGQAVDHRSPVCLWDRSVGDGASRGRVNRNIVPDDQDNKGAARVRNYRLMLAVAMIFGGAVALARHGDICSKHMLSRDFKVHVEFRVPLEGEDKHGQDRGNSGVYIQGRYECQVLDSYGKEHPDKGDCGAIYGIEPPTVNASKAPTVW